MALASAFLVADLNLTLFLALPSTSAFAISSSSFVKSSLIFVICFCFFSIKLRVLSCLVESSSNSSDKILILSALFAATRGSVLAPSANSSWAFSCSLVNCPTAFIIGSVKPFLGINWSPVTSISFLCPFLLR